MTAYLSDLSPLYGVLAIDGADAATFLQGQATCDARAITADRGALGALCNLQGRIIASFFAVAGPQGLLLVMPRERVAAMLQHLKKYAVFAKVTLRDASDGYALHGLLGTNAETGLAPLTGGVPADIHAIARNDALIALRLRGRHRFLLLAEKPSVLAIAGVAGSDSAHWQQAAIAAGEILVDGANADRWLPQALNYDLIDGVSFRKGCYTGQEVVARMHFKGRMKERLQHGSTDAETPEPGTPVFRPGNTQAVGHVVTAVCTGERTHLALVVRHDAVAAGDLRLGNPDGTAIDIQAMPYALPDAG